MSALEAGGLRRHRRDYAQRSLPSVPSDMSITPVTSETLWLMDAGGQILMFDLQEQRHASHANEGRSFHRARSFIQEQIQLPFEAHPHFADMLLGLGATHAAIAAKIGCSRSQITNIINGQFGASRQMVLRVLELARAA